MINADLIAEALPARLRAQAAWIDHPNRAPERIRDVMLEAADALEAKEREHPSNCNCGYGGFHEPENKNCEANQ